jgi:hypothetical protein
MGQIRAKKNGGPVAGTAADIFRLEGYIVSSGADVERSVQYDWKQTENGGPVARAAVQFAGSGENGIREP